MEGARSHSLYRVVLIPLLFLGLGFILGWSAVNLFLYTSRKKTNSSFLGANPIMLKRTQAIKEARKAGKTEYEFEVAGFYPTLGAK